MTDERLSDPRMSYYKEVFKDSPRWTGEEDLTGKKVIVYGEQGFGDIIQFARYIPHLKSKCDVAFYVPKDLHRLFGCLEVELLDKDNPNLPEHDYHVLALDLPFALQVIDVEFPYLKVDEVAELDEEDTKRIGIAWEGNPTHTNSFQRDCPLKHFKILDLPFTHLYMIQKEAHDPRLLDGCDDMNLLGYEINDFYDTAMLINAMDVVITVDTAVLHLAGALNKLTYALLPEERDPRWDVHHWYHSVVCVKQKKANDWDAAFRAVLNMLAGIIQETSVDEDLTDKILQ